jgi:hypothetical protein
MRINTKSHLLEFATTTLGLTLLTLATTLAAVEAEDEIEKSFVANQRGQLVVQLDRGIIEVQGKQTNTVTITIQRRAYAPRSPAADALLERHEVNIEQEDDTITVRGSLKGGSLRSWFGRRRDVRIRCLITVPNEFNLQLKTTGGAVSVAHVHGEVRTQTTDGGLLFTDLQGPVHGRTSAANINAHNVKGDVQLRTSGGSIRVDNVEGAVTASTSAGSISLRHATGPVVLHNSRGNIELEAIHAATQATSGGGSILASLDRQPKGDVILKTSDGSITVSIPQNVGVDVDARSRGGRVISQVPVTTVVVGEQKRNILQGSINGGGPNLVAHTSDGNVYIENQ